MSHTKAILQPTTVQKIQQKEPFIEFANLMNKQIKVTLINTDIIIGTLCGIDNLINLVVNDSTHQYTITKDGENQVVTRYLGRVICRSLNIVSIAPIDGSMNIPNPFLQE
uniref:U6 snRNA-associated Sm-like protein LSm7 n=1 Tax=Lygus hesperus TaxID=30085 RepID=A0A0A9ZHI1_LYGHE